PEHYDWRSAWPRLVASTRPDAVVVMVGVWDIGTVTVDGHTLAPGNRAWAAWYTGLALEATRSLTAGGAPPLWPGAPWMGVPGSDAAVASLDGVLAGLPAVAPRTMFVDTRPLLAGPGGGYAPVQPGPGGVEVRVMKPDGEHLCPAGAARLGAAVVARL